MSNRQKRLTHDEAFVELENVELVYGRGDKRVQALTSTSLTIGRGDFVALVGPSGCGKSTILKLVTGLLKATKGYVYVSGREVGAEPMRVGMAFQNPTLLPWKTIRDNVMLPSSDPSARPSSATASMRCSSRSDLPALAINIPGNCPAA